MRRASLNHNYRLVWSDHANAYVAVAEGTRARGKSTRAGLVALAVAQLLSGTNAYADGVVVAPGSGGTNVYNAPNGVPVVNIDKANAAGLSHNKFTNYNVGINGLILNNGNSSQIARQSQLAGQIIANTNLSAEAKFILNEVVAPNRTQLLGYTEVLGGKADVIIANPYGITCGGCGFINTDRVTLTTGTPNILSSGALGGFTVNQGDILINGKGLDGTNQSYFDIVTRNLKVDGQVNAKELHIVTGTNTWDYGTRNVTVNTASGTAPSYAFDSTALGGMYANRIFIKATEAGVGVRMLGEAAASADDFTINAAGKIEIKSKVSAERDIALTTTSTASSAITLTDAQITAKRNLELTAQTGNATFNGGLLVAGNNLTGVFASLDDTSNTTAVTDNNKRYADGALSITVTNAANINGTNWGAKGNLTGSVGSLSIGANGASIYSTNEALKLTATTGNLSLGTAAMQAAKNIDFIATAGNVSTSAGSAQGVKTTTGNISINAQTGLNNAGVMSADTGGFTLRANGNSTNSGTIYAKTTADIADKTNTATQNFTNSGTLIADDTLTIKATTLTNSGKSGMQAKNGTTINATTLDNSANLITSTVAGKSGNVTVATLTNSGTIQSAQNLTINASNTLSNNGKLLADNDLSILANANALAVSNTKDAVIQAKNALKVTGSNATFNTQAGKVLGNTVDLTLSSLDNSGTVQSEAGMTYAVSNAVTNSGTILAKSTFTGSSDSLNNSGTLQANQGSTITATNSITNSGTLIGSDSATASATLNTKTLSNTAGAIQSKQNLNINLSGNALSNAGKLLAEDDLTINSTGSGLTLTNHADGFIQAGTNVGDILTVKGTAVTLNNNAKAVMLGGALDLVATSLDNAGTMQSEQNTGYTVTNVFTNSGTLLAKGTLTGSSDYLNNSGTLQANQGSTITTTKDITNSGALIGSVSATASATLNAKNLVNTSTGAIQSKQNLNINLSGDTLTNAGKLLADDGLTIDSKGTGLTVTNQNGAFIQAGTGTDDVLKVGGIAVTLNNNTGAAMLGGVLDLVVDAIDNAGTMQSEQDAGYTVTNVFTNSGTLLAKGALSGSSDSLDNSGTLQANQGSNITVTNAITNSGTLIGSDSASASATLNAKTLNNTKTGVIQSKQNLNINLSGDKLENAGKLLAGDDLNVQSTGSGLIVNNQSGGFIQSGTDNTDDLAIKGTAVTLNNSSGAVMFGSVLDLVVDAIDNGGKIQSEGNTSYTVKNDVVNAGTLLVKGALTGSSNKLNNSGLLQANQGSTITVTEDIVNTGTLIGSASATASSTLKAKKLRNLAIGIFSGTIQSKQNLSIELSGDGLENSGKLLADDDLTINSTADTFTLTQNGYIQAGTNLGDDLTIKGKAVTLNNGVEGTILGDRLDITTTTLDNKGTIQGGAGASSIQVTNKFTNSGTFTLATIDAGGGSVSAESIDNSGILQSGGSANLNVATELKNSNKILSSGDLTVRGTGSSYVVKNTGRMQSGGLMDIKGQGNTKGVDITISDTAVILGNTMDIKAGTLTIDKGGMLSSTGDLTADLDTLTFGGTTSRIVGSTDGGTSTITLANAYSNIGAIHSGGKLNFTAPRITNTKTGGFSALDELKLNANGVFSLSNITNGLLVNEGALYAGNLLTVEAKLGFLNKSTVDSDKDIAITTPKFTNQGAINALKNIDISATTFENSFADFNPERITTITIPHPLTGAPMVLPNIKWGDWDYVQPKVNVATGNTRDRRYIQERFGSLTETFATPLPTGPKPQIIAGGDMRIRDFTSAKNIGGILAASSGTMTITGKGDFINDDLSLTKTNYRATQQEFENCDINCDAKVYIDYQEYVTSTETVSSAGAGIFAKTLVATGFNLKNNSSPWVATTKRTTADGASGESLGGTKDGSTGASGADGEGGTSGAGGATEATGTGGAGATLGVGATGGAASAAGTTTATGAPAISFSGLVIALPTNPNGFFVLSKNPQSKFLVETNPLFAVGADYISSDYMAKRLGLNPDLVGLRLGDAAYEANLIRQQLIAQTGRNILAGYENEKTMIAKMYDNAGDTAKLLGLNWGQPLTSAQIANLQQDLVWMVETTVAGKKVLAPVVYLAKTTIAAIQTGAVIAANDIKMDLKSFTNTGGTVEATNSFKLLSEGDIINTSGKIKGGDIDISTSAGSIINETKTSGSGNSTAYATSIGKTAGIESTGNLKLDAKNDIKVTGADVSAGGNAQLSAGKDITFDTIVDKTTTSSTSASRDGLFNSSSTTTTTTTEKNIGSSLKVGGNLSINSGGDTTLAGSKADVGGNLDAKTGGSFNVVARQDKVTTNTQTSTSGLGVGGGIAGSEKVTTENFKGTNVGSTLNVGGNANIKSDNTVTIQGSDVTINGNAKIDAKNGINVLDGLDEERTTTKTETTTYFKTGSSGESGSSSGSKSESESRPGRDSASASANANAGASGDADLKFAETTVTTTKSGSTKSVASNLKIGGNLTATSEGAITIQGSNVETGGDMTLDAKDVVVLTGRNEEWSTTETTRNSVGIYNEGNATADAEANASSKAGVLGASGEANAGAEAKADGTVTIGGRTENERTSSYKLTNTSSSLKSGGNMTIKAKEEAKFVGANVESAGDITIEATKITNLAAQDIEISTSSKSTQTAGLYLDGEAGAQANANADAGKINIGGQPANAEAKGEATADASTGIRFKTEQESSVSGSVKQVTNTFKSGGNITRNAKDTITDQGTQIEAAGDINQQARVIQELEASDSTFSSKNASSHDIKLGVGAGASANAGANSQGESDSGSGAGAGGRAKYEGSISGESERETTAVTTRYKSGGNINSKSEENTSLIGTKFESGGDINIEAGSLDYQAARDTSSKSKNTNDIDAKLKVDVVGKAGGSLDAEFGREAESENTSTAQAGGINAGGNLNIKTKGDAKFEGTQIEAGKNAKIDAGGKVDFTAARDTSESTKQNVDASLSVSTEKKGGSKNLEAEASYEQENNSSSKAQVGGIKAGQGISITSGEDANFEGTKLNSGGDISIDAGGDVNLLAAKNTETETGFGVSAGIAGGKGDEGSSKSGTIGADGSYAKKVESDVASIDSSGNVNIKGKNVTNQEANIKGEEGTNIVGNEIKKEAENSDFAIDVEVKASGKSESKNADNNDGDSRSSSTNRYNDKDKSSDVQSGGPQSQESISKVINLPAIPAGAKVELKSADGKPMPSWLKFDQGTGKLTGTPPADFKGNVNLVVKVPQADGSVREMPVKFEVK